MPPSAQLNSSGTSGKASAACSTSASLTSASMNSTSAPVSAYIRARASARSSPSTARASVRAMITNSGWLRASTAAWTLAAISSAGMTSLPSMWPHFLGATWSSMWIPATPAAS